MVYCNIGTTNENGIRNIIYWVEDDWTPLERKELWEKYDIVTNNGITIMFLTGNEIAIGTEKNGEISFSFDSKNNEYLHSSKIEYFENFVSLFNSFKSKLKERE